MSDKITVQEAAERWNLSERNVTGMCASGRIEGARKEGRIWYIPENAEKPADGESAAALIKRATGSTVCPFPLAFPITG